MISRVRAQIDCLPAQTALLMASMPELTPPTRQQKITLGEMRASDVRGLLIYCSDYKCAHSVRISGIDGRTSFVC